MQNLRLDQAENKAIPSAAVMQPETNSVRREAVFNLLLVTSVFLVGMAAGNLYHPYQGKLAVCVGVTGLAIFIGRNLFLSYKMQQQKQKEAALENSLTQRLKRHVDYSFRTHSRRSRRTPRTMIADRYRQLSYVPIAHVDEI